MMRKLAKRLLLPALLGAYAFTYLATSYQTPCEGKCEKYNEVSRQISNGRPYIASTAVRSDTMFAVYVYDSLASDWTRFPDTVCAYFQAVSLPAQRILVLHTMSGDTLANKRCP